jgi:hypothetical protein
MNWPATLPCFRFEPYQVSPRSAVLEMDFGLAVRRRQIYADMLEQIPVELVVTGPQEVELRDFYNEDLEMGTLAFDAPIQINGALTTREVRFIGAPPDYVPVGPNHVRVTATLLTSV